MTAEKNVFSDENLDTAPCAGDSEQAPDNQQKKKARRKNTGLF
jgi:hypothetical protein